MDSALHVNNKAIALLEQEMYCEALEMFRTAAAFMSSQKKAMAEQAQTNQRSSKVDCQSMEVQVSSDHRKGGNLKRENPSSIGSNSKRRKRARKISLGPLKPTSSSEDCSFLWNHPFTFQLDQDETLEDKEVDQRDWLTLSMVVLFNMGLAYQLAGRKVPSSQKNATNLYLMCSILSRNTMQTQEIVPCIFFSWPVSTTLVF